jgi:hypothetical protein
MKLKVHKETGMVQMNKYEWPEESYHHHHHLDNNEFLHARK